MCHHLPVVANTLNVVAQLDLGSQRTKHHCLHVSHWEPIRTEVTEHLVIEKLLLHRIRQVDVVIQKQMLLEEEHVMSGLPGM